MPNLIFIHGPPACGKLTIARELAKITSYKLFHNHLTIDMIISVFDFGTPNFIKYREKIWLDVIGDAISEGSNLIFTFNPEATVDPTFHTRLEAMVKERGGNVKYVEITCPDSEIVVRIESESRKKFRKLWSGDYYKQLVREDAFRYPVIESEVEIDSLIMQPEESALLIANRLGLPVLVPTADV